MNQKGIVVVFLLSLVFVSSFVSAAGDAFKPIFDMMNGIYEGVIGLLSGPLALLLGETSASADLASSFLPKLLIALLVYGLVVAVLGKVPLFDDRKWIVHMGGALLAILGVRSLTYEFILTAILPNAVLAVSLTAILPFVVFFFVTREFLPLARKLSWLFLAVLFLGMWLTFPQTLGDLSLIYPLFALISVLFIMLDRKLEALWARLGVDDILESRKIDVKIDLMKDFDTARAAFVASSITKPQYKLKLDAIIKSAKAFGLSDVEALAKDAKTRFGL